MLPTGSTELMDDAVELEARVCRWMWMQTLGVLTLIRHLWKERRLG